MNLASDRVVVVQGSYLLIRNGHIQVVKFLVDGQHCNSNAVDEDRWTSLHFAAR